MNILFVTPRIPYPLDSGGKIRTFNLLRQAHLCGNKVTLLSFVYCKEDIKHVKKLEEIGIKAITVKGEDKIGFSTIIRALVKGLPLTVSKYHSKEMTCALKRLISESNIDLIHFDHLHLGQYVNFCNGKPSIIDEHNVESVIWRRLLERKENNFFKSLIMRNEYSKTKKLEKDKCLRASRVIVVSQEEKEKLVNLCRHGFNPEIIPNGVDIEHVSSLDQEAIKSPEEDASVFVGSMDWLPNSDAVEYFYKYILPLIWKEIPHAKFYIVGKKPSPTVFNLAKKDDRIVVAGGVDDICPYLVQSKVLVVPLRIGAGTRLKILEALAMRKAVVSTSIGAEGLDVKDGQHLFIADNPEDFARRVIMLFNNNGLRVRLGEEGNKLVRERYDWKIIGKKLNEVYRKTVKNIKTI